MHNPLVRVELGIESNDSTLLERKDVSTGDSDIRPVLKNSWWENRESRKGGSRKRVDGECYDEGKQRL